MRKQIFDGEGRNNGGLLFQSLKEKQKGQFLYLLAWRCLVSFAFAKARTDLSDAPAKAMLRILRFARRRCGTFLLSGPYPHALRSGHSFYACKLGYPCRIPSAKREGQSEIRENPTAPGTRQCASAQQTEADRPGSAHRTAFANADAQQPWNKPTNAINTALFGSFSGGEKERLRLFYSFPLSISVCACFQLQFIMHN